MKLFYILSFLIFMINNQWIYSLENENDIKFLTLKYAANIGSIDTHQDKANSNTTGNHPIMSKGKQQFKENFSNLSTNRPTNNLINQFNNYYSNNNQTNHSSNLSESFTSRSIECYKSLKGNLFLNLF